MNVFYDFDAEMQAETFLRHQRRRPWVRNAALWCAALALAVGAAWVITR